MLLVAAVLVFGCVALTTYALLDLAISDDRRVSRRLKGLTQFEVGQARKAQPMIAPFAQRVISPVADSISSGARAMWPAEYRDRIARRLDQAGRPGGIDVARFGLAKALGGLGTALLMVVFAALGGWAVGGSVLAVAGALVLGFFAPDLWLSAKVDSRQHAIVRSLPDMLDMLTISVEAGLGFDAALAKLVRNGRGPLAEEFGRVLQQIQSGASRKEALRAMAARCDVPELSAFTASIVQADIFGISVAQVLRTQSAEMRLRRKQRAEEQAQKLPVKMVIPLVLCLLPATIIVVAGPAVVRIFDVFGG